MRTSENYEQSYAGNNSTSTPYPITNFQFDDGDDLEITTISSTGVETMLTPSQYAITRDTSTSLGSFTTASAIPLTSSLKIARKNILTQDTDYIHSDAFPAESHERSLDRIIEALQYIRSIAQRAVRVTSPNAAINAGVPGVNTVAGLDPSGNTIFRNAAEMRSFISLTAPLVNQPTKTWANNAERALAVPDFLGQLGSQRDTGAVYVSTAVSAGSWSAVSAGSVADNAITTSKLADGALSADSIGRAKMADNFLTLPKWSTAIATAMTAKALMEDADYVLGYSATDANFRKFPGNVVAPPGSIIQIQTAEYTSNANLSVQIPNDNTIPQITEGTQIISVSITPRFADSLIYLNFTGVAIIAVVGPYLAAAIFRSPTSAAIASVSVYPTDFDTPIALVIQYHDAPASTSAQTYTVRAGPGGAGIMRFNGLSTGRIHGGSQRAVLTAMEIKV